MVYKKTPKDTVKANSDVYIVNNKLVVDCSAINRLCLSKEIADVFKQAVVNDYKAHSDYISDYGFVNFAVNEGTNNEIRYCADYTLNRACIRDVDTGNAKYRSLELSAVRLSGYDIAAIRNNESASEHYETGCMVHQTQCFDVNLDYTKDKGINDNENILVNSPNWQDREEAAKQGYGLDKFVDDEDWGVREEVAKHGRPQDLDVLVHDKVWIVRAAVAEYGRDKDLDVLVKDSSPDVRVVVAKQGRPQDLKALENDDDIYVRDAVRRYKENHPDWDKSISNEHKDKQTERVSD